MACLSGRKRPATDASLPPANSMRLDLADIIRRIEKLVRSGLDAADGCAELGAGRSLRSRKTPADGTSTVVTPIKTDAVANITDASSDCDHVVVESAGAASAESKHPYASFYGEFTLSSLLAVMATLQDPAIVGLGRILSEASVFVDIGSGLGRAVWAAAAACPGLCSVGIEYSAGRAAVATRLWKDLGSPPNVELLCGDVTDPKHYGTWQFTHMYAFDRTFPPDVRALIERNINACPSWKVFMSCHRDWDLRDARLLAHYVPCKMCGSGSQHALYIYVHGEE